MSHFQTFYCVTLFLQVAPCVCLLVSLPVQSASAMDHSAPGASKRWETRSKSLFEAPLQEKRREKTPMTDVKVFSDDTHQSIDATHTREYNVHV